MRLSLNHAPQCLPLLPWNRVAVWSRLNEVMLAAAAMQGLLGPDAPLARQTLRYLAARHGQSSVAALLDRREGSRQA